MTWKRFLSQLAMVLAAVAVERLVIDSPLTPAEPMVKPTRHEAEPEPSRLGSPDLREFISSRLGRGVPGM
jgi:hypothetical protein